MATYQSLYNSALATIKSRIYNYSPYYGNLPAVFKPGAVIDVAAANGNDGFNKTARLTAYIANPIGAVSESTINNAFSSVMSKYNINGNTLYQTATPAGLFNFYVGIAEFCCSRLQHATSVYASSSYLVYIGNSMNTGASVRSAADIINGIRTMYATDAQNATNIITAIISSSLSTYAVYYSFGLRI